jgi:hypothetical protein
MRAIKLISVVIMIACSATLCHAQGEMNVMDKTFQTFLDRFRTVMPPLNFKKYGIKSQDMTEEEAIKFLNLTKSELYPILREVGEDDEVNYYKEENIPGCKFKYVLNDNVYVLCVVSAILGTNQNTIFATLYTFSHSGEIIDKCLVSKTYTEGDGEKAFDFVLLDKTHVRMFYYADNDIRKKEGFLSTVYSVNYEITGDGKFVEKDKSDITWLKNWANKYSTYKPQSDDPMNAY